MMKRAIGMIKPMLLNMELEEEVVVVFGAKIENILVVSGKFKAKVIPKKVAQ